MTRTDWEAARERIRAARANEPTPETPDDEIVGPNPDRMSTTDLGARMYGRPYEGDELAAIADRMFRH